MTEAPGKQALHIHVFHVKPSVCVEPPLACGLEIVAPMLVLALPFACSFRHVARILIVALFPHCHSHYDRGPCYELTGMKLYCFSTFWPALESTY
jgi:hypothetical protein